MSTTTAYALGVLSIPALILGLLVGWIALKALGWLAERLLVGGVQRLTPETPDSRRAATAGVIYGGRRVFMFAPGDLGFIVVCGLDWDRVRWAGNQLRPTVALADVTASDHPGRRVGDPSVTDANVPGA